MFEEHLIPVQLCVVSGYSAGWQAGLANIRDEDLMICCTKSSSITQAGSELDFLFSPRATGRTQTIDLINPLVHNQSGDQEPPLNGLQLKINLKSHSMIKGLEEKETLSATQNYIFVFLCVKCCIVLIFEPKRITKSEIINLRSQKTLKLRIICNPRQGQKSTFVFTLRGNKPKRLETINLFNCIEPLSGQSI